jgi:LysR family transcriptional regulator, glycine cleavage system transcriptional activator
MRRPRLNALRTFETVGRRLSFSLAAEELHITQAAVSQQIRQLEADLGQALFHRHHRRISLTGAARGYLPAVQEALALLDKATERQFGAARSRQVTIRCTSSIATQWLAPHVRAFQRDHPDITLHFRTLETVNGAASAQQADIEIFCAGEQHPEPGLAPLFDATITPVAAPGFVARKLDRSTDILGLDLIHVVGYNDDWHRWFATYLRAGAMVPDGLSVDSSLFAIDAALRGDGIHLGRSPFIDNHLKSKALVAVFDTPLTLKTTYFMREHKTVRNSRYISDIARWISGLASGVQTAGLTGAEG